MPATDNGSNVIAIWGLLLESGRLCQKDHPTFSQFISINIFYQALSKLSNMEEGSESPMKYCLAGS